MRSHEWLKLSVPATRTCRSGFNERARNVNSKSSLRARSRKLAADGQKKRCKVAGQAAIIRAAEADGKDENSSIFPQLRRNAKHFKNIVKLMLRFLVAQFRDFATRF